MQRILLAIAGAAAFCAAVTFLLQIAISRGLPATDIVLVTASATLLLSIGAAAFAYRAFNRANLVANDCEPSVPQTRGGVQLDQEVLEFADLQGAEESPGAACARRPRSEFRCSRALN